ncbi:MAG TPA: FHA domain-containing protein [Candidatus Saccharimonadales bacterium]|nr:FHA domain-containing protein [Candidatus Saccharimonadales bacterium]
MVQLQILSGNRTGTKFCGDHFPIRVGRAEGLDFSLDEPGVWPRHFQIGWQPEGLILEAEPDALVSVNDAPVRRAVLRNGDIITLGSLKIRFSLSSVRQSSMTAREWLTWIALGALCLGQVALVYLLLRF